MHNRGGSDKSTVAMLIHVLAGDKHTKEIPIKMPTTRLELVTIRV